MGQLRLRLMYANDLNKKILVVRKSGMKITEIKGLPKGISYTDLGTSRRWAECLLS